MIIGIVGTITMFWGGGGGESNHRHKNDYDNLTRKINTNVPVFDSACDFQLLHLVGKSQFLRESLNICDIVAGYRPRIFMDVLSIFIGNRLYTRNFTCTFPG